MHKSIPMLKQVSILFVLGLSLLTSAAIGQTTYGLRLGSTFSHISQTDLIDAVTPEVSYLTGFTGAVFAEVPISSGFSFRPELAYSQKGFSLRQQTAAELFGQQLPIGVRADSRFDYLETPLLLKSRFGKAKVQGFVLAGPGLGYATGGQLRTRSTGILEVDLLNTAIDLDAINYERFELSGIAGGGVQINTRWGHLMLEARYQHGFTELYDIPMVAERVRNQGFNLGASLAIPLH